MEIYYTILFFVFGIVLGSFYNVVGYRVPNNMSLIKPGSHCTKCNHRLTPIELIPVFSYIFQFGKCKKCGQKISIFYPIFELLSGILFALTYILFGISIKAFIVLVLVSMILIIIISDILYMIIPDSVLIFCGSILFILKTIETGFSNIPNILFNMIIPFLFMLIIKLVGDKIFKKESLGGGDVKLMLVFGMVLGGYVSIFSVVLASFIALPISLISLIKKHTHELPFGPYLGISALICLFANIDVNVLLKILGL